MQLNNLISLEFLPDSRKKVARERDLQGRKGDGKV